MNLTRLQNGAYQALEDPGEPMYGTPRVSITDMEGELLAILGEGKCVLEIGTGLGVSTRYLAKYAKQVVSVDIDPWVQKTIWPGIETDLKNVVFLKGIGGIIELHVDLVFIDGCHEINQIKEDVRIAKQFLNHPGLIVFHDANAIKLEQAIREDPIVTIHTTFGIAIVEVN